MKIPTMGKMSTLPYLPGLLLCLGSLILSGGSAIRATHATEPSSQQYQLRLYDTHTGEHINVVYRQRNAYIRDSLAKLDYFLRDHRTGDVRSFDPKLFDLLEQLSAAVGHPGGEIDVICGYRTPRSNQFLRTHTKGVAKHSLHMQAEALDIRIPRVSTEKLRQAALALHWGGVGYYPHSNFVHVDVGRVRHWCFECSSKQSALN